MMRFSRRGFIGCLIGVAGAALTRLGRPLSRAETPAKAPSPVPVINAWLLIGGAALAQQGGRDTVA